LNSEPIPEEDLPMFDIFKKIVALNFDKEVLESNNYLLLLSDDDNVLVLFWSTDYPQYIAKFVQAVAETWAKFTEDSRKKTLKLKTIDISINENQNIKLDKVPSYILYRKGLKDKP
jgi:hypothetical protein